MTKDEIKALAQEADGVLDRLKAALDAYAEATSNEAAQDHADNIDTAQSGVATIIEWADEADGESSGEEGEEEVVENDDATDE